MLVSLALKAPEKRLVSTLQYMGGVWRKAENFKIS